MKNGVSERSVCSVEGGMCFPGAASMCSICESGYLLWEYHGVRLYVKQIDRCYLMSLCVCVCVCVCVGVVQKNKKEVKRWEAYVSVTCTWLPECLYMLGLPIAICKDSLVTYSVCTCV